MTSLTEKIVLITVASSGIGAATARLPGQSGAKVFLGARSGNHLTALCDEINAAGGQSAYQLVNVTRADEMQALTEAAITRFGQVDVLVSNAGIMPISPLAALHVGVWDQMIDVNIRGVLHGIAAVLRISLSAKQASLSTSAQSARIMSCQQGRSITRQNLPSGRLPMAYDKSMQTFARRSSSQEWSRPNWAARSPIRAQLPQRHNSAKWRSSPTQSPTPSALPSTSPTTSM